MKSASLAFRGLRLRAVLQRIHSPVAHGPAKIITRKRIIEVMGDFAKRHVDQKKGGQDEVNKERPFTLFRPVWRSQRGEKEKRR